MQSLSRTTRDKTTFPYQRLFEFFGTSFHDSDSDNIEAEECPICGKPGRFYINRTTGQYSCKHGSCNEEGNQYSFIRKKHTEILANTKDGDRRRLSKMRGLSLQTVKRFNIVWYNERQCYLIPTKNKEGNIVSLLRYYPDRHTKNKLNLPGFPTTLFGLDKLADDKTKTLLVCEGPFDAISLDQHLRRRKTRDRYDILAVPGANIFKDAWTEHLKGREVRLLFDNDKAGSDGQNRIARKVQEARVTVELKTLCWPSDYPEKTDIGDLIKQDIPIVEFSRDHCIKVSGKDKRLTFTRGDAVVSVPVEWLWPGHIPFGTFVSLSGDMGTQKSTIARDLAARATSGACMPNCDTHLEPFDVIYFTSEDAASRVAKSVELQGGDLSRLHTYDMADGDLNDSPIDLLECLDELERQIKSTGARLVIIDALNSFVGGEIQTDSKARRTLSGRLQSLARRTGACVIGIRNWGRGEGATGSKRALGATSLSDVARCVINTVEVASQKEGAPPRRFLQFEKVSDAKRPRPVPYQVIDLSAEPGAEDFWRKIEWDTYENHLEREAAEMQEEEQIARIAESIRKNGLPGLKRVAKKGSVAR